MPSGFPCFCAQNPCIDSHDMAMKLLLCRFLSWIVYAFSLLSCCRGLSCSFNCLRNLWLSLCIPTSPERKQCLVPTNLQRKQCLDILLCIYIIRYAIELNNIEQAAYELFLLVNQEDWRQGLGLSGWTLLFYGSISRTFSMLPWISFDAENKLFTFRSFAWSLSEPRTHCETSHIRHLWLETPLMSKLGPFQASVVFWNLPCSESPLCKLQCAPFQIRTRITRTTFLDSKPLSHRPILYCSKNELHKLQWRP